jgi:hypothetical protein
MLHRPDDKQIFDVISFVEEKLSLNIYPCLVPVPLTGRNGNILGYYCFYEDKAFRLDYSGIDLTGVSFWDEPASLMDPTMYVDMSDLDDTQAPQMLVTFLSALPSENDNTKDIKEVEDFLDYMGEFLRSKKASEAFDSYEPWAETHSENPLDRSEFYVAFNLVAKQTDKDLTSRIEVPFISSIILSDKLKNSFESDVSKQDSYYTVKMLKSAINAMAEGESSINAMFVCGPEVEYARGLLKDNLQDAGVWNNKVLWKNRTTSIYQFITLLWKYRSGYILVFDNVESPLKNKNHNFNNMLDELMKTESPNRVLTYSRHEAKN